MKQKLLLSVFVILFSSVLQAQPAGWQYRMPITITNSGATLYGAVIPIYINTASIISSSQMLANGNDVRFGVPCNGTSLYNYYIDSAINTSSTKFLVQIDTLPSGSKTIFMFYGNPSATQYSAATTNIFSNGPISANNSVSGGTSGGVGNCQRGFQFIPTQEILVTAFGKNTPSSLLRYVTLFQVSNQSLILQDTVSGPVGTYSYSNLYSTNAPYTGLILNAGTNYVLEVYCDPTDPTYYYQTSSSIASQLTYVNMLYCNSCSSTTYPTTVLSNYHYGYPDMRFYTLSLPSPLPTVSVGSGSAGGIPPNITSQPVSQTVCAGSNTNFSISVTGTNLSYQWQVNTGSGFINIANNATYSGATTVSLSVNNVNTAMSGAQYQCVITGACASATSNAATLNINALPAFSLQPFIF